MRKLEVVTSVPQAVVDVTNEMGKILPNNTTPKQTMYIATPTKSSMKRKAKSAIRSKIRTNATMSRQKSNLSKK